MKFNTNRTIRERTVIILLSAWLVALYNISFFKHVLSAYPVSWSNVAMLASLPIVLMALLVILFSLLSSRQTTKPVMIIILLLSSLAAYFMDTYDTIIDTNMIRNIVMTNFAESSDLMTLRLASYFLFLGVLPSVLLYRLNIEHLPFQANLTDKLKTTGIALLTILMIIFAFSKFYTSFIREHKPLRLYTNPSFYIYSAVKYAQKSIAHTEMGLHAIGMDARIPPTDTDRELVILVIGETARADHFSLNGYERETNPLLKREEIINFQDFTSCGTDTAVSVPCMFSSFGRAHYDGNKALHTENLLDVLSHAGVHILWRDNNSDSKGVALRAQYEDFRTSDKNPVCDEGECRDEGMLDGLQKYIDSHPKGDILIVLHQMGNHGPAYYKRYPGAFEKFTPSCKTNQLEKCSQEEIINAYDNAILYTDHFLSKVIALLKRNQNTFEAAMFYVSDHGESLGENGMYLHGYPYALAPRAQKHVPAIMWIGKRFEIDQQKLVSRASQPYSHDHVFHTMLSFFEIQSTVYRPELDILQGLHY